MPLNNHEPTLPEKICWPIGRKKTIFYRFKKNKV